MEITREYIENMEPSRPPILLTPDPYCGVTVEMASSIRIRLIRTVYRKGRRNTVINFTVPIKNDNKEAISKFRGIMSKTNK